MGIEPATLCLGRLSAAICVCPTLKTAFSAILAICFRRPQPFAYGPVVLRRQGLSHRNCITQFEVWPPLHPSVTAISMASPYFSSRTRWISASAYATTWLRSSEAPSRVSASKAAVPSTSRRCSALRPGLWNRPSTGVRYLCMEMLPSINLPSAS